MTNKQKIIKFFNKSKELLLEKYDTNSLSDAIEHSIQEPTNGAVMSDISLLLIKRKISPLIVINNKKFISYWKNLDSDIKELTLPKSKIIKIRRFLNNNFDIKRYILKNS